MDSSLIGKFFHVLDEFEREGSKQVELCGQGWICGKVEPGWYMLQMFDWIMGEAGSKRVASISDISGFLLYDTKEEMKESFETGEASKYRPDLWKVEKS